MTKSSHTLKVTKGSKTYTCDLYGTTAEAAVYGASSYLPVNVSGTNLYAPLYPATGWTQTFYDNYGTPLHVSKGGSEYVLATHSLIRLGITAVANETITVTAGGESWSSGNKYFPYGTTWTATVNGNTGYNAGSLTPASSGTLTNANVTVTAGAASLKTYTLNVGSPAHQTVVVKYKNRNAANTGYESEQPLNEGESKVVRHFSTWTATVTADTGWTAGALSPASSGTISSATTVSAGAATHKTFVLTVAKTTNQTIKFQYRNYNGSSWGDWSSVISSSSSAAKTYTLGYGSQYKVTKFTASTGYTKGTLNVTVGTTYTLTAAKTISATAATAITPKVTITSASGNKSVYVDITYTNTSGTSTTASNVSFNAGTSKSYTIKYNTKIKIYTRTGNARYNFKVGSGSYSGNYIYHETYTSPSITSNTTITFTAVNVSSGGGGGDS